MTGPGGGGPIDLVLASSSPRRREILRMLGLEHRTMAPDGAERPFAVGEDPVAYAEGQARAKLRAVLERAPGAAVVAADTIVLLDGRVLGKPSGPVQAAEMLRTLAGRRHAVITGVAVAWRGREALGHERTTVDFCELDELRIARYVQAGEPLDKAGAYGIQGRGATLVQRVEGCFFNVVGLPVARLTQLLGELELRYDFVAGLVPEAGAA